MTEEQRAELAMLLDEKLRPLKTQVDDLNARIDHFVGQRRLLLMTTILALVVTAAAIVAVILVRLALVEELQHNREYGCASARSAAVSPLNRFPREHQREYIERMLARREQLLKAGTLNCNSLPSFSTFPFLRGQAIHNIEELLERKAPRRLHQVESEEARQQASKAPTPLPAINSAPTVEEEAVIPAGSNGPVPSASHGDSTGGASPPPSGTGHSHHHTKPPHHHHPKPTPAPTPTPAPPSEESNGNNGNGNKGNGQGEGNGGVGQGNGNGNTTHENEAAAPDLPTCHVEVLGKPLLCVNAAVLPR